KVRNSRRAVASEESKRTAWGIKLSAARQTAIDPNTMIFVEMVPWIGSSNINVIGIANPRQKNETSTSDRRRSSIFSFYSDRSWTSVSFQSRCCQRVLSPRARATLIKGLANNIGRKVTRMNQIETISFCLKV